MQTFVLDLIRASCKDSKTTTACMLEQNIDFKFGSGRVYHFCCFEAVVKKDIFKIHLEQEKPQVN